MNVYAHDSIIDNTRNYIEINSDFSFYCINTNIFQYYWKY